MAPVFTCITCGVAFADADLQRSHYKTDWHRYNLKRKVASLPPVTAEGFNQRVIEQRAQVAANEPKETPSYCKVCGKHFASEAAYQNHLLSAKHKHALKLMEESARTANGEGHPDKQYLATESVAPTPSIHELLTITPDTPVVEVNKEHSVTDMALGGAQPSRMDTDDIEKQGAGEEDVNEEEDLEDEALGMEQCLFCSKISKSVKSNVKHMTSVHSFFIPDIEYLVDMEGFLSYLGEKVGVGKMCLWCSEKSRAFLSVKAVQQHMLDKGHCMLQHDGDAAYEYADYYDYSSSYPQEEEGGDSSQLMPFTETLSCSEDDYELILPSGAKIGHRALSRYYKQNLVSRLHPEGRSVVSKVMSHYKALGWKGATGTQIERRVKDLAFMQRQKQKYWQQVGIKSNRTSMLHYRYQIMMF